MDKTKARFFSSNIPIFFLIFRLVQLDKLRLATVHAEEDASLARGGKDPFIVVKAPSASKGGVAETSIKVRMVAFLFSQESTLLFVFSQTARHMHHQINLFSSRLPF